MLRASVSVILLLSSLFALAKYAIVSHPSHDTRTPAPAAITAHVRITPLPATDLTPSARAEHAGVGRTQPRGVIRQVDHVEVIFDDDTPPTRIAGRFRNRRSWSPSRAPAHPPAATHPPTGSPPNAAAQTSPRPAPQPAPTPNPQDPTPATPRPDEPTPALRRSTQAYLERLAQPSSSGEPAAVTPRAEPARPQDTLGQRQGNTASGTQIDNALPSATEPQRSDAPLTERPEAEETLGESGGLPPGVDPWYAPPEPFTRAMAVRRDMIRQCLKFYYDRPLNSREHSPWSLMHAMIAWGTDSQIAIGAPNGRRVSAVHWLCSNGVSDGVQLLYLNRGELAVRVGPGLQGHESQFLALLAQTRVSRDYPLQVEGRTFTVNDLIEQEKLGCRSHSELTFRLIGLAHYLDTDAQWKNRQGETWDFPRLLREEMGQPINGAACGGTHRLMGMNYAIRRREYQGKEIHGEWAQARALTARYQQLAFSLQNRDGSFSCNFFRGRGDWGGIDRKLKTTGHILEWMVFSLPHDQLQDPRLTRSVDMLTNMLLQNRYYEWEKGPIGHAIRALSLYDERVFGGRPGHRAEEFATRTSESSAPRR